MFGVAGSPATNRLERRQMQPARLERPPRLLLHTSAAAAGANERKAARVFHLAQPDASLDWGQAETRKWLAAGQCRSRSRSPACMRTLRLQFIAARLALRLGSTGSRASPQQIGASARSERVERARLSAQETGSELEHNRDEDSTRSAAQTARNQPTRRPLIRRESDANCRALRHASYR